MIEELARVAAEAYFEHPIEIGYITTPATGGHDWVRVAEAILQRLKEPSEEMIMAGIIERHDQPCPEAWKLATANIFTAMITAISEQRG